MQTERRNDAETARVVADALELQRKIGFEPAFLALRARGVGVDLARDVLALHIDRRLSKPAHTESR